MPMTPMVAGMRIAGRFVLDRPAACGAMGTVFQARDLQTGLQVALKLLHADVSSSQNATRLELEGELLAKLRHPHIVAYIAHGRTPSGQPFLVMEWLEGEDLAARLRRSLLSLDDCLLLLRGVAAALQAAHNSGVVHRDIKPSNLFLPGRRIDQVKLLDFGVACEELAALRLTRTGSILGTLQYMAPEQARGARHVGPAADIFSLGCVIYECLAGQPPLPQMSFPELLIKISTEEIPPLSMQRPGLPPALLSLLQRMLAKSPDERPQDGAALLRELDLLGDALAEESGASLLVVREPFAPIDQRLLCMVLANSIGPGSAAATLDTVDSPTETPLPLGGTQETLLRWGAFTQWLRDGSLLVTLAERGNASDLAAQAARVALHLSAVWPTCTAVLATGLGAINEGSASGEVIGYMREFIHAQRAGESAPSLRRGRVWLDSVTAGLVDGLFNVRRVGPGLFELIEELDYTCTVRRLAGHLTRCVGRERELETLTALLGECLSESMARVALVVAPHGRGKSRLRYELLARLAQAQLGLTVLLGRGDRLSAAVSGALLSDCLHQLGRLVAADRPDGAPAQLVPLLRGSLPAQIERCLAPLRELGSQPLAYEGTSRAMQPERRVLHAQIEQAFVQLMQALSGVGPILIVLDDLQCADALSVQVINRVLGELAERPLMILALARPEVHTIFPRLWAEHRVQELRLQPLSPAACEQLLYTVLGPTHGAQAAPHIMEHSRGNPLFLEELILVAVTDSATTQLPETLITLERGLLLRLPALGLRVLRAASLFGMHFWEEGLYLLLTPVMRPEHIESGIQALITAELISRQRQSRFPHTAEFRFRHALTLAAIALFLSEADRELGRTVTTRYL